MKNLLIIFALFVSGFVTAQTPTLQALVSKTTVPVGGNFTVSYQFNYSGEDFTAPSNLTKGFRILGGPNKRSEMSYVNGTMTSKISYSYVLSPLNPGEFVIKPAQILFENKVYSSQEIKITVVKAQNNQSGNQTTQTQVNNQQKQIKALKNSIYLKLSVDKKEVFQGEQIVATYKLYNKAQLRGIEAQRMPEFNGFYTTDIELNNQNNRTREIINGVPFDVFTLKKTILIPQKSGELNLIPLEIDAIVQIQGEKAVNTWFGPRYQMKDVKVLLKSQNVKINVKPLPAGAPDGFNGAVGNFKFSTSVTPTNLMVNDALNYVVKISGSGNLPLIDNPVPEWPQEFEVYDPKLKSSSNTKSNKITGSKSWDYLAIPRNGGEYVFKGLSFTYFNPRTKKYKTITQEDRKIVVEGNSPLSGPTAGVVTKQDVSRLGTDIRFIHTTLPNLKASNDFFFGSSWFYFWLVSPVLLGALAYVIMVKQSELQADTVGMKKRKATKFAKTQLKSAETILASGKNNEFYDAVSKALYGYLSNKFNLANIDLNKNHIKNILQKSSVLPETQKLLLEILDHCEMARFAPVSNISDLDLLKQAQNIIIKLEDEIK
ncbi:MAG: BatD family protein [Salibacteraceae bacterium]